SSAGRSPTSATTSMSGCASRSFWIPSRTSSESSATTTRIDTRTTLVLARIPIGLALQLLSQEPDDRHRALRRFPRVGDPIVIHQPAEVGGRTEQLGGPAGQRRGLEIVAVGREALQPVPKR